MKFVLLAALFASLFLFGCLGGSQAPATPAPTQSIVVTVSAEVDGESAATITPAATVEEAATTTPATPVPAAVQEIKVTAKQFSFAPNPIAVKKGVPVKLLVTATDVEHGFSLPAFGINKNLPVGQEVAIEFIPDKAGSFPFFCSVFCGSGHGGMSGSLTVTE